MFPALLALLLLSQAPPRVHSLTGDIRSHRIADRDVLVYLPPSYDATPAVRYPVLYLQDGQNVFDGATSFKPGAEWRVDETAEQLIRSGKMAPVIIVAIYNLGARRVDEYSPVPDPKYKGGGADAYGRMLLGDLKPFIDAHYRTDPLQTGIGGSSLGGLVALYFGLTHPDVFNKVAALSPSAFWADQDIVKRVRNLRSKLNVKIWLDTGTNERTATHDFADDDRALRDALVAKGWRLGVDLTYTEAEGAEHNEAAWAARVPAVLQFLYPK